MAYRAGFIGATTGDATDWVGEQVQDAKKICVPFTGTGKDISSMLGAGRMIESWDTQVYSRYIVEGIFAAPEVESAVDKIRYKKGIAYEARGIKNIDERCAGFIDWVVANGTSFDKATLASAIVRSTLMGRMTQWYVNMEQLWGRFNKMRAYNAEWVNRPGTFVHHEASVFDVFPGGSYDLVQIDSPKIVVGTDVYYSNFRSLNTILEGKVELPKWTSKDVMKHFRRLNEIDAKRIVFLYVSGVTPSYEEVKDMLLENGTLEDERSFKHKSRIDYGLVIRRN